MYKKLLVMLIGAMASNMNIPVSFAEEDHPLITRYEGSTIQKKTIEDFGEYKLITNQDAQSAFQSKELKGKLTRIVYANPSDRSTLEIFDNYRHALERAGMQKLFTCALNECGPAYARSAWGRYNGLFAAADGDPRYISGEIVSDTGTAYVALMVGKIRTQLDVLEIQPMEDNLVIADANALGEGLDRDGKVSIYGILFDFDKAHIKSESKAALDEIAKLLAQRPTLTLYVVGHTDMIGTFAHNRNLSEARARAVVQELITHYGIKAARLEGYGVGPLAPVASNSTPTGQAKNRRVELVQRVQ
jgi:OOP family OmpA-OmpF porin